MLSAEGDLGKALFILHYCGFSVHLQGVKRGGVGIGKSFSNAVSKYPRLCQAPWPMMNTNDPGAGVVHSIVLFLCRYACPLGVSAGGIAVALRSAFAF